jgi:hypothetical protein
MEFVKPKVEHWIEEKRKDTGERFAQAMEKM